MTELYELPAWRIIIQNMLYYYLITSKSNLAIFLDISVCWLHISHAALVQKNVGVMGVWNTVSVIKSNVIHEATMDELFQVIAAIDAIMWLSFHLKGVCMHSVTVMKKKKIPYKNISAIFCL